MGVQKNELTVIMKSKDLCSYIVAVTQKSPKQFRFTFVSRLQNLAMDVIENIYRANEVFIGAGKLNNTEIRNMYKNALKWETIYTRSVAKE